MNTNINLQPAQDQTITNAPVGAPSNTETINVTKTDTQNNPLSQTYSHPTLGSSNSLGMELLANPGKANEQVNQQSIDQLNNSPIQSEQNYGVGLVEKLSYDNTGMSANSVSDMTSPRSDFSLDLGFAGQQPEPEPETVLNQPQDNNTLDDPDAPKPVHMMTASEVTQEKQDYLYKFKRLQHSGISPSEQFSMNSDLNIMREEYDRLKKLRDLDSSIKFQKKMLMAAVTGIEFLNDKFDPFDVQLSGWGETINEGLGDYDEVFEELHEKYKSKAKVAPELRLMFMLGGSAFMFHLQQTMFKSSIPGMGDIMKQNPDLMKQFAQAAMSSATGGGMGGGGGGGGGGMSGLFGGMGGGMGGMGGGMGGMGGGPQTPQSPNMRPEMRGPPVEEVLSGFNQASNAQSNAQSDVKDNMSDISSIAGDIYTDNNQGESNKGTINLSL
jgi:hypothetical protein